MISKYKSTSRLGKIFIWLSIGIFIAAIALYVNEVIETLAMDPNSYYCMHDSMTKQRCEDPFGTSIGWAILLLVFVGWPVLLAWMVIGAVLLRRRARVQREKNSKTI